MESLDNIQLVDYEGNTYNSFIFRFYHKSPKGLETEMSAPSIRDATVNYQNVASALEIAKRTEIIVNKQEQEIIAVVEQIGDRSYKSTTITQDIDSIQNKVNNIQDLTREVTGVKTIILENAMAGELLSLRIKGNNTVFSYLYPANDLYPSDTLYPKRR